MITGMCREDGRDNGKRGLVVATPSKLTQYNSINNTTAITISTIYNTSTINSTIKYKNTAKHTIPTIPLPIITITLCHTANQLKSMIMLL